MEQNKETIDELIDGMARDFTAVQGRSKSEVRHRIDSIMLLQRQNDVREILALGKDWDIEGNDINLIYPDHVKNWAEEKGIII